MPANSTNSFCLSCRRCVAAPCERLRFGGVAAGRFLLVSGSEIDAAMLDCPFAVHEFEDAARIVGDLSLVDLISAIDQITSALPSSEAAGIDPRHYINAYGDYAQRMQYLHALWDAGAVRMIRVPDDFERNKAMRTFLMAFEALMPTRGKKKEEQAAAMDGMEETVAASTVDLTNPRWEHVDEKRKEKSPHAASGGDRVKLAVDVKGIPEGAEVVFDIFDSSQSPPMRVATVKGTNEGGVARAVWDLGGEGPPKFLVLKLPAPLPEETTSFTLRGGKDQRKLELSAAVSSDDGVELKFDDLDLTDNYALEFGESGGGETCAIHDKVGSSARAIDFSKLTFEASARGRYAEQREISLEGGGITSLKLRIPTRENDAVSLTLSDAKGVYSRTVEPTPAGDSAEALFDGADPAQQYTLSVKHGEQESYDIFAGQTLAEAGTP